MRDNTIVAFFALVRAGLWGEAYANLSLNVNDNLFEGVEWEKIYQLAQEQSVLGLVLAGLEQYKNLDVNLYVNQKLLLQWIGEVQLIEQRNKEMNQFIAELVERMREMGIYTLLMKGQGVAQCYERPLWRSSGDVDFFLSDDNYKNAKDYLVPLATSVGEEFEYNKHLALIIEGWEVELHGNLYGGLWRGLDRAIKETQDDVFYGGSVRSWKNGNTQIFLPNANEDVFFVFTHILQHYFKEGIGLRQICDWCRLLWIYRESIDKNKLAYRLKKAGVISEWQVFANLAVCWLGMPLEAMPLYSNSKSINRRAKCVLDYIIETGNFGHNKDLSYKSEKSALKRKVKTFGHITGNVFRHMRVFPIDSIKVWCFEMLSGLRFSRR